jgi:RNA polymerase sigma factor (sigma-70 family)
MIATTAMTDMEDRELLDEFVRNRSQGAFQELVTRHLPVVYSAARRMVQDPHMAEEIAQAVFTTLARKAESIRPPQILGGWLYNTTRHLAMHAIRTEQRRRKREQTAFAMQSLNVPNETPEIAEHLEPAMAELDAEDRDALVLRFLANRGLREVGAELGISEEAARKRVNRALERLRAVLEHRQLTTTTIVLAAALTASVVAVPQGLGATISSTALAPAVTAAVTKATLIAMKTKTVIAIAAVAVVGTGTYLLVQLNSKTIHPPAVSIAAAAPNPTNTETVKFPNSFFHAEADPRYTNGIDSDTKRTPDSAPAGHIKSLIAPEFPGAGDYLRSLDAGSQRLAGTRSIRHYLVQDSPFLGKRVRISGWIKTRDVQNWAGGTLTIMNAQGHIFSDDQMNAHAIRGTADWQQIEMVADIPNEPCVIIFAIALYGTGELWADDFQLEAVPAGTPVTDDRIWHMWSTNPNDYSVDTNSSTLHDGHPTVCITYVPEGAAPNGSWMWWGQDIREPDKFRGHTVRMTAWIKTENVTPRVSQNLRPKGANFKLLETCTHSPVGGTSDWTQRIITCFIPEQTQCLDTGFAFTGSGRVWIDMNTLKYEITD